MGRRSGQRHAWKNAGFKPVVLSSADLVPSLQVGKIDALCYPPVLVLAAGMHNKAKFMLDFPYSSLTGVTVVDKNTWEKVPADLRPRSCSKSSALPASRSIRKS